MLILFYQMVSFVCLNHNWAFCLLLNFIKNWFLFLCQIFHSLVTKQKFSLYFCLSIIELRRLLLYRICYWRFLFQYLVYHFTSFCYISVLALNFGCSICHFVDRLIDHDFSVRLPHDFINLMSFCSNEKRYHAFRYKYYNWKELFFNFFKDLINIMKKAFGAMIFFVHIMIKNLYNINVTCMFLPSRSGIPKSELNLMDYT